MYFRNLYVYEEGSLNSEVVLCLGFQSAVLGLVADSIRKIWHRLSSTKPRTSDWKPSYAQLHDKELTERQ